MAERESIEDKYSRLFDAMWGGSGPPDQAMLENARFLGPREPAPAAPSLDSMRRGYGVLTDRAEPPNDRITREMLQQWQSQGLTGWRTPPMKGGAPIENPLKGSLAGNLIDYLFPPRPTPWLHQPRGMPQYDIQQPDLPPPPDDWAAARQWGI